MRLDDYSALLDVARRHSRVVDEAEDLLQEALFVACKVGRIDLTLKDNQQWLKGVIRNLATQQARTAVRRKKRDDAYARDQGICVESLETTATLQGKETSQKLFDSLSPAVRKVAVLALCGLNRQEICTLLQLSDTAFRQRLTALRKAIAPRSHEFKQDVLAYAYASRALPTKSKDMLPLGLIRRALLTCLHHDRNSAPTSLGTHDPSGHLIVFS